MKANQFLRFSWRGFTPQLFVLVVLPLAVLIIVIAFGGLSLHRQAMRMMVGERDERAVRSAAGAISEQLNHREKAVHSLALLAGDEQGKDRLQELLADSGYLDPDFDFGLAYFARGGVRLAESGDATFWETLDTSQQDLKTALTRDVPPAFVTVAHPETGLPIVLSLAVAHKGGVIAAGAFDPATLARRAVSGVFFAESGTVVLLVDATTGILFQAGEFSSGEQPENHPGIKEGLTGNSGTSYVPVNGSEHVVSYSSISPTGWALIIEEPWEAVSSPLLQFTEYAPFVLIPALLLALVALWFGLRQIVLPLQSLETQAAELAWGNYDAIEEPVGGIAEIRHLQNELIHLAHKVRAAQAGLRGYIGVITEAQEEERRRLARELHDDTLQALIALNQRIHLARIARDDATPGDSLAEIQELTTTTIQNLRRLTRALRPIYLEDLGLVSALEVLARETQQLSGVTVEFLLEGSPRRLSSQTELALYRMTQEALNNVVRHSGAGECQLEINFTADQTCLQVSDNGAGFVPPESPSDLAPQGHFGLLGLHERAELIGAVLEIDSSEGGGTRIRITLAEAARAAHSPP